MTHVSGAAVCLSCMVFGSNVVARGMRPSGVLPSVVVAVDTTGAAAKLFTLRGLLGGAAAICS